MSKVALVTGVGKKSGIGFEIARGILKHQDYQVIFNARDEKNGKEILESFENDSELKGKPHLFLGDLTKSESIDNLKKLIQEKFDNKLHVIVNNAGVLGTALQESVFETTKEEIFATMEINTIVPLVLAQTFVPLMKNQKFGRIVNVSSGMGQLSEMGGTCVPYRFSKCTMNALTRILDAELKSENILVNTMCPGFVKTEFTPFNVKAPRTAVEGADTAVWLATLDDEGPRGKFFRDRKEITW